MEKNEKAREYFAKGIKTLRKERNYTQQDLADVLHISTNTISSWETARTEPCIQDICQLCVLFKADFCDIIAKGIKEGKGESNG